MPAGFLRRLVFAVAAFLPIMVTEPAAANPRDAVFDGLLTRYVKPNPDGVNRVDYAAWKANTTDREQLSRYVAELQARTPSKLPRAEAIAYWSNLYNAITLDVVLARYPIASIRDIKSEGLFDPKAYLGPWRTKRATVEGKSLSLDDIEHEILRPTFKDPRIHYAVNCASFGCPNLRTKAWAAATLDADLDAAARDFINHPRGIAVLPGNKLKVSSIYKWFIDDFGGTDAGVIAHLKKYAGEKLAGTLTAGATIASDDYIWTLNDAASAKR